MSQVEFFEFLKETDQLIRGYFNNSSVTAHFRPDHIHQGAMSYLLRPAKRLRPAIVRICYGCFAPEKVTDIMPVAAALELFHTWTLVHDDIIDNDEKRRGQPTAHVLLAKSGKNDLNLTTDLAKEYGRSAAILAGDVLHGWVTAAFLETALHEGFDPWVVMKLLHHLETEVLGNLIYGELRDVQLGMAPFNESIEFDEDDVIVMEHMKTAVLLQFAAQAGAMLAKETADFNDPDVEAVTTFAGNCGLAFQLQDDILGISGDERRLGKPIGSDIREGKKTVVVLHSLRQANESQRQVLLATLGNRTASGNEVNEVIKLLHQLGGLEYARKLADKKIKDAFLALEQVPDSHYRTLLSAWAEFMVNREL